jgi:hypothetical protein
MAIHLIGSLLLLAGGGGVKVGLDLDLVATKTLVGFDKAASLPLLLKPSVERCNSKLLSFSLVSILKLVSFAHQTFSLSSTPGALCVPGAALAF